MNSMISVDKQYVANTYKRFPLELVSGKGSIWTAADGKQYIDMGSGIGVTSFGMADDQWIQAVTAQLSTLQKMIAGGSAVGFLFSFLACFLACSFIAISFSCLSIL